MQQIKLYTSHTPTLPYPAGPDRGVILNEMLSVGGLYGQPLSVSSQTTSEGRGPSNGLTIPFLLARCPMTELSSDGSWRVGVEGVPVPAGRGASAARFTFVTAAVRCRIQ